MNMVTVKDKIKNSVNEASRKLAVRWNSGNEGKLRILLAVTWTVIVILGVVKLAGWYFGGRS